ncbi:MAG: cytochrome c [Acidobacteriota bacterium]|nr:cytochrome c [Acidobacteriota bacterium]
MRRLAILFGGVAVVVMVLGAAPGSDPKSASEVKLEKAQLTWAQVAVDDGEVLYTELCAVCHGIDAKGNGPAAPALAMPTPDLTHLAADNGGVFPSAEVEKAISGENKIQAHGTSEMPIWGAAFENVRLDYKPARRWGFARMRVYNLTSYLETLQAG